jgi:deoxyribodipyrimidine photo-lyase
LRTGCVIERDYPAPLVEVEQATREARARLLEVRRAGEAAAESRAIVKKHGSRKGMPGSVRDENGREHQAQRKRRSPHPQQKELFE